MSAAKKFKRQTTLFSLFGRPKPESSRSVNKNDKKNMPKQTQKSKTKQKKKRKQSKKHMAGQKTLMAMFTPVNSHARAHEHLRKRTLLT